MEGTRNSFRNHPDKPGAPLPGKIRSGNATPTSALPKTPAAQHPGPRNFQRLDKWLWYARITRTRSLAQKLIRDGGVRVDGEKTTRTCTRIAPPMVLTIAFKNRIRILRLRDTGTRRGPASQARELFEDLSPTLPSAPRERPAPPPHAHREPGSARPTKKQRRQTIHLLGR